MAEKPTVLVVDDREAVRTALNTLFREHGYKTFTAGNGGEAIGVLAAERVNVLVTDYSMPPGMTGVELIRNALAIRPELVAILLTAENMLDVEAAAREAGAVAVFSKPAGWEVLERAVLSATVRS